MPEKELIGPIRTKNGPTWGIADAAREIGVSEPWIRVLVTRDPEQYPDNNLAGYVKHPDRPGWVRKIGTNWTDRVPIIMFYEQDVKDYKLKHPDAGKAHESFAPDAPRLVYHNKSGKPVTYTVAISDEERQRIVEVAQEQLAATGSVNRTQTSKLLKTKYGYSDRIYHKVLKLAKENNWPAPPPGRNSKQISRAEANKAANG